MSHKVVAYKADDLQQIINGAYSVVGYIPNSTFVGMIMENSTSSQDPSISRVYCLRSNSDFNFYSLPVNNILPSKRYTYTRITWFGRVFSESNLSQVNRFSSNDSFEYHLGSFGFSFFSEPALAQLARYGSQNGKPIIFSGAQLDIAKDGTEGDIMDGPKYSNIKAQVGFENNITSSVTSTNTSATNRKVPTLFAAQPCPPHWQPERFGVAYVLQMQGIVDINPETSGDFLQNLNQGYTNFTQQLLKNKTIALPTEGFAPTQKPPSEG